MGFTVAVFMHLEYWSQAIDETFVVVSFASSVRVVPQSCSLQRAHLARSHESHPWRRNKHPGDPPCHPLPHPTVVSFQPIEI